MLVAEGLRQLQERGLQIGMDHVTLEAACAATDVPRSSSHAAWSINDDYAPQAMFQRSVVRAWLSDREDTMFASASHAAVAEALERKGEALTGNEIIRVAIQAAFVEGYNLDGDLAADEGDYLSTDMAIRHAIASQPSGDRDPEMLEWLRTGEMTNRDARIEDTYKPMGEMLGRKPRPEYGERAYTLFGIAVAALVEGIGMRHVILPELALDQPLFPAVDGEEPTLLIGACVEGLVSTFFEPVDADN